MIWSLMKIMKIILRETLLLLKRKNQNIDKKQNGVVVIFGEPWQLLLTGSAVPRIHTMKKSIHKVSDGQSSIRFPCFFSRADLRESMIFYDFFSRSMFVRMFSLLVYLVSAVVKNKSTCPIYL